MNDNLLWNANTESRMHHYLMQPGDGTLYRFCYGKVPIGSDRCEYGNHYIIASGISDHPEDWIIVGIQMTGSGMGVISQRDLKHWPEHDHPLFNMQSPGNGFEKVNNYTCVAVLFALKALVKGASADEAAKEMLKAKDWMYERIKTDG